jgi:hypothetical protein
MEYMPSVIITDNKGLSVYTDKIREGIIFVGKNYRQKNFVGNSVGFYRFFGSDVVVAIEESKNLEDLTIKELMGSLQAHKQKIDRRGEGRSLEQAL